MKGRKHGDSGRGLAMRAACIDTRARACCIDEFVLAARGQVRRLYAGTVARFQQLK
jgi:hypothetical protein